MTKELAVIVQGNGSPALRITRDTTADFMPLTNAFQIHRANEFLRTLKPVYPVYFGSWEQYGELIDLISDGLTTV